MVTSTGIVRFFPQFRCFQDRQRPTSVDDEDEHCAKRPRMPAGLKPDDVYGRNHSMETGQLFVGATASFTKTLTEADLTLFTAVSGDFNPYHVDEVAAAATRFGGRVLHGMLTSSLICTVLGMKLPGPGTIHLEQQLRFLAPVRPGDTVTARVEVLELLPRNRVRLQTQCATQDGTIAVEGKALVIAPRG